MKNVTIVREYIEGFPEPFSNIEMDGINFVFLDVSVENQYNIDKYFTEQVDKISENKPDIIFIPSWIGQPLHYLGVRLAMHIRLSGIDGVNEVPLVFLGAEKEIDFFKNCSLSKILKSQRIYYTGFNAYKITEFLNEYDFDKELEKPFDLLREINNFFDLSPPANYRSHHSVDNDWALLRWSQYIGCENEIDEVKENLETGLYFKWLQAKYGGISEIPNKKQFHFDNNAKILLIDDEATKGWKAFYESFFNNSPKITFQSLDLDFNLVGKDEVIEQAEDKIYDWDPDIILLDLRLSDEDFAPDIKPTEMTGYQILEKAKAINSGIQVIITTASNKIWNYKALQEVGADEFLMKSMESEVDKDVSYLFHAVKSCSNRKFLKKLESDLKAIKYDLASKSLSSQFVNEFKNHLDLSFSLLIEASKNINVGSTSPSYDKTKEEKKFAYAFISLYPIIEIVILNI